MDGALNDGKCKLASGQLRRIEQGASARHDGQRPAYDGAKCAVMKATRGEILAFLFVVLFIAPISVALTHKIRCNIAKTEVRKIEMKTICIGRFLIDIPADARVSYRRAFLSGFDISTQAYETDEEFEKRIIDMGSRIKSEKNQKGLRSLEAEHEIRNERINGRVFIFGRAWTSGMREKNVEDSGNVAVNGFVRGGGVSYDFNTKMIAPVYAAKLPKLLEQLVPRQEHEIPTLPGFCFDHGIIVDPLTADQGENVVMFVGLKDHPDVSIALDSHAGIDTQKTLLERDDENDVRLQNLSRFHTFRRGPLKIAGIQGEELLERISEPNFTTSQSFTWESIWRNDDVFTPFLSLELSTGHSRTGGKPVNSSFSDEAALALWGKMLSSLRVRPTKAVKPAAAAAPPPPPLGTVVLANQACPASGWWRCGDDDVDVPGGAVQYLRAGERVPQTELLVPPTLWQRVRGKRPTFQRSMASHWTLVNHRQRRRTTQAGPQAVAPADVDDERTPAPVGTLAASGQPCPESGWWLCADAEALDLSARWFGRGEILPSVWFKARRSWFERLKGRPAAMRCPTTWKLARHADMPALPPNDTNDTAT